MILEKAWLRSTIITRDNEPNSNKNPPVTDVQFGSYTRVHSKGLGKKMPSCEALWSLWHPLLQDSTEHSLGSVDPPQSVCDIFQNQ